MVDAFHDTRGTRWSNLRKFNPNHDDKGRFSDGDGAGGGGKDDASGGRASGSPELTTPAQQAEYANFSRFTGLSAADREVEDRSIRHYITDKAGLQAAYIARFGDKEVNADLARRLFESDGYTGTNAAAVQEAASALAKDRWREALTSHPDNPDAVLYAGGSGSGKSTAIEKLMPHVEESAAAVLDGNLSKMSSATGRIKEAVEAGKSPHIIYAYREPSDAWENGVIARMLNNKEEKGRVVPMSVFIDNSIGSLGVARALKADGRRVTAIDNSRGRGNAEIMSDSRLASLTYPSPSALRATLTARTTALLHNGTINESQYHALLQ